MSDSASNDITVLLAIDQKLEYGNVASRQVRSGGIAVSIVRLSSFHLTHDAYLLRKPESFWDACRRQN